MTIKTYVIAGDHYEFLEYREKWRARRITETERTGETFSMADCVDVHSPSVLIGVKDPHGVFIGTWRSLPNIKEIVQHLLIASVNSLNPTLQKIYKNIEYDELAGDRALHIRYDESVSSQWL